MKRATAVIGFLLAASLLPLGATAHADEGGGTEAPVAAAASYFRMSTDDGDPGGFVRFHPTGDRVELWDDQPDGKGVFLVVTNVTRDPNFYEYHLHHSSGYHTSPLVTSAEYGQPSNLAEGACIRFETWLIDNGELMDDTYDRAQWRNNNGSLDECPGVD